MALVFTLVKTTTFNGRLISTICYAFATIKEAKTALKAIYDDQNDMPDLGMPLTVTDNKPNIRYRAIAANEHGYKTVLEIYRHVLA